MANDLVSSPWTPPESEIVQKVIKYGSVAAVVAAGVTAFLWIGPTIVDVEVLVTKIFANGIYAIGTGVGLIGALFLARETLSPNGSINHMLRLPYWSIVNGLTRTFIVIDPLSTLTTRINSVRADQVTFEKQFETLDGLITNLHEKAARYREQSLKAQKLGVAATRQGASAAADVSAHRFGSYKEAADSYDATAARLDPVRATFQKISQAADVTAQKLEIERDLLRDRWETQQAISKATAAASRILGRSKTQVWQDAQEAENIINNKYGEELGHLDHLKRFADPFLQSIDVENASYNADMLREVESSSTKLIESTNATPLPASATPAPAMITTGDGSNSFMSGLIR